MSSPAVAASPAVADAEFRYADLLPAGADDTPYRLDLVAQGAQGPAIRLWVQLPSRSGSWPGIRLRSANSGAIISSMASRSALAVASKKRRARTLLFSCSDDTAASSSFFLPTGVHRPRDCNIYDATRGVRRIARRPIQRSAWNKNSANFRFTEFSEIRRQEPLPSRQRLLTLSGRGAYYGEHLYNPPGRPGTGLLRSQGASAGSAFSLSSYVASQNVDAVPDRRAVQLLSTQCDARRHLLFISEVERCGVRVGSTRIVERHSYYIGVSTLTSKDYVAGYACQLFLVCGLHINVVA